MTHDLTGLSRRETMAVSLGLLLLAACQPAAANNATSPPGPSPGPPPGPPPSPSPQAQQVAAATAAFGFATLRALLIDAPQTTLVTSPLSLMADMLMLGQGARGATAATLTQALQLPAGATLSTAAAGFANIAARMVSSDTATMQIADGLWADNSAGVRPAFLQTLQSQFAARASTTDLSSPAALADINGFVNQTTQGAIPTILDAPPAGSMIVLVNALHFKGGWFRPFDPTQTQAAPFTCANGTTVTAQLMSQSGDYLYGETDQVQAVALPFADNRFQLALVLTKPGAQPDAWVNGFSAFVGEHQGQVLLPRLGVAWGADLSAMLGQLGLGPALASSADYSGAMSAPLGQVRVVQKCMLRVDEQGAEAAAATATMMAGAIPPNGPPFVFRADRPFYLMLSEIRTGAPLILAYVAAPGA
jgi:serine protease inhibitor